MNPSNTTSSSSLTALVALPSTSSSSPTLLIVPSEIRGRIFEFLYVEARVGTTCAVNRQIFYEAQEVLLRTHPLVKVTAAASPAYIRWMRSALPTVQTSNSGAVTHFKHYSGSISIRSRNSPGDYRPTVHIMLAGVRELRTFCCRIGAVPILFAIAVQLLSLVSSAPNDDTLQSSLGSSNPDNHRRSNTGAFRYATPSIRTKQILL